MSLFGWLGTARAFSASAAAEWKGGLRNARFKLKTHRGAAKRFQVTPEGQFVRAKQHLRAGSGYSSRTRHWGRVVVHKTHHTLLRKLLPYAGKRAAFRRLHEQETCWWKSGNLQKEGQALEAAIERAAAGAPTGR